MAKRTGNGMLVATLGAAEFLQYTLTFNAAGPNMVWTDDQETQVLSDKNFPALSPLKWQLRTATQDGSVVISVPQNAGYSRTLPAGTLMNYQLTLTFLTSTSYTLIVQRCNTTGPVETVSDFQYTMDNPDDLVLEGLGVQV